MTSFIELIYTKEKNLLNPQVQDVEVSNGSVGI